MVGSALLAYLLSQRLFGTRLPPILPAFIVGLLVAWLTGQLGAFPSSFSLPSLEPVRPSFSFHAILTATPVLIALLATVQSNIPSIIYMRTQGFSPPRAPRQCPQRGRNDHRLVLGAGRGLARAPPPPAAHRRPRGGSAAPSLPGDLPPRRSWVVDCTLCEHRHRHRHARSFDATADDGGACAGRGARARDEGDHAGTPGARPDLRVRDRALGHHAARSRTLLLVPGRRRGRLPAARARRLAATASRGDRRGAGGQGAAPADSHLGIPVRGIRGPRWAPRGLRTRSLEGGSRGLGGAGMENHPWGATSRPHTPIRRSVNGPSRCSARRPRMLRERPVPGDRPRLSVRGRLNIVISGGTSSG